MKYLLARSADFNLSAFGPSWFHWTEVEACFWPGLGKRSASVNPALAPVCKVGGVYLIADASRRPRRVDPKEASVRYIGETYAFKARMESFGWSAGFWGKRRNGHSAAWRWEAGSDDLWVAFFPVTDVDQHHLRGGIRKWYEAVALEAHRRVHGKIPELNELDRRKPV